MLGAALLWRLHLLPRFYGWEESDYGNLAMAQGVLASGFTAYDMNHLPLYYALSAAVLALVGDAVVATRVVSLAGGMGALLLVLVLARRLRGTSAMLLAGLLVAFQPEFALYSASALREPVYAFFLLASLAFLGRERLTWASAMAGLAFLVRFDALPVLGLVLGWHALGRPRRGRRLAAALLPLAVTVMGWSAYCARVHGTWRFWEHSVQVNLETGGRGDVAAAGGVAWLEGVVADAGAGLQVVAGLSVHTLPGHLGWGLVIPGVLGAVLMARRPAGAVRTTAVLLAVATGFWLLLGFAGRHEPGHNLYWKWLLPLVPLWGTAAAWGYGALASRMAGVLGPLASRVLLGLVVVSALVTQVQETQRQVERSQVLYRPQLELARWIEREVPSSVPLLVDNIPGCWLDRRPHGRELHTWMDVELAAPSPDAFGRWLISNEIGYVLWFREAWTQAPETAPFLANGGSIRAGPVRLEELDREDEYGWIFYRVHASPLPSQRSGR